MVAQYQKQPEPTWFTVVRLLRWDRPTGRLILMVPALWAVFLAAEGTPPLPLVGVIVLGSITTSAAGCVINDLWDRNIDPQVERTRNRPLASRALSIKTGIVVAVIALACAAVLAFYLNPISFFLCVAAVPVIVGYPLAKRVFPVPQLVMAIAWGFTVVISWSAISCESETFTFLPEGCLGTATGLLWGATVLWALGFDTVYAMSDREDDRRIGVNSSALFFGNYAADAVGVFFAGTAGLLVALGLVMDLQLGFWIAWAIAVVGWSWQYVQLRFTSEIPKSRYGGIFRQNVGLGFILLAGMIAGSIWG
ncbi:MAG: 4-hydroxybenzoate octaprenyltransferase [Cyanobacteria bacterium QH_8_48_120]|jgi:4-hydroxybenzoate polyprenyltransferase|nr:MAG: 4-hydroxybenzoate octaprenyltransferase [Cyanobacteria bacterium QH_6_48_35]PSO71064.1 MAG: 4-hydroxybenzoate octaprenyltransferase [Cyanobacteria bacterium QH_8_48_120]PSO99729.1 MAG: 4-hydroxybenzoate octaprenyltransferase [Cyanobacteria bacterium SW_6_48_11]